MKCQHCETDNIHVEGYGEVKCPICKKLICVLPVPVADAPDAPNAPEPVKVVWEAQNGKKFADQVMGDPEEWIGKYRRIDILGGMDVRIKIKDYELA